MVNLTALPRGHSWLSVLAGADVTSDLARDGRAMGLRRHLNLARFSYCRSHGQAQKGQDSPAPGPDNRRDGIRTNDDIG
jgi:hypothetical protein